MIFLNSLFGYLSLLIVIKWCTGSQADLYHVMIYMFLSPTDDLGENQLFWGQKPLQVIVLTVVNWEIVYIGFTSHLQSNWLSLQIILLLLALIAVPWMLFPKPFILKKRHLEVCSNLEFLTHPRPIKYVGCSPLWFSCFFCYFLGLGSFNLQHLLLSLSNSCYPL